MFNTLEKVHFNWFFAFLFGLATSIIFLATLNSFWTQIMIGIWVSCVFYSLVQTIPAYLQKQRQKKVFLTYYKGFKIDVIDELFLLIDYQEDDIDDLKTTLLETSVFRTFFRGASQVAGQTYRDVLLNALADDENRFIVGRISELFLQLEREVDYLTRTNIVEDTELLTKLRSLSRLMGDGRLRADIEPNREDETRFVGAIFEIFSGWNSVSGETGDFIKTWIERI